MGTMTIELINDGAGRLLHDLEEMHLIKIIAEEEMPQKKLSFSEKYKGLINEEQAADLNRHINEMRNEWERDI